MGGIRSRAGAQLSADAQRAKWQASEARRATARRVSRGQAWQGRGQAAIAGLIRNQYAGVRARRNEEGK